MRVMRQEVFRSLLMQKIEFFDQHSYIQLTGLISDELRILRGLIVGNSSRDRGIRAVLEVVGCVTVLAVVSWRLGPILAILTLSMAISTGTYKLLTKNAEANYAQTSSQMNEIASEVLGNIKIVRSFGSESLERENFGRYSSESFDSGIILGRAKGILESITRGSIHLSIIVLFSYGGYLIQQGILPIRTLLLCLGYIYSLVFSTQGLTQTYMDIRKAKAALDRIRMILQSSQPDPKMAQALPPGAWWDILNGNEIQQISQDGYLDGKSGDKILQLAQQGDLVLKDLYFSYPLRPESQVLKGFNLRLKKGTVTALVGHSGAGKSTIAALLSRFYEPSSGQITLGDYNIYDFSQKDWVKSVAMVSQEPVLFSGSIADNISYGKFGKASEQEITSAARAANAHDFIMQLPDKYDTNVGSGGSLLSGGQRQRVALARALLKDSPVIILDEATSALDATSEKLVGEAVQRLIKGKTVVVIAHRLSTIQNADNIVVVEDGQVVEEGNHNQLVQKAGKYVELMCSPDVMWSGQFACLV
eukprot:TRINITY_DN4215_c1_g2_i4.p1 TRINITY_DN4215_c1_g2~~TRINITY_DN4215_c1_g2_i4.p1  ORF type:complete len:532 (-),score=54.58 TRINITY_DN4215_c1_g2_i4:292-1887(-)